MQGGHHTYHRPGGFTLIELSIVLVIIGLIVGGILAGRSLIGAAAVRAQIAQIEKFNTATNTFRDKYGALPGDLSSMAATQFGFVTRAGSRGRGDGNGIVEGYSYSTSTPYGWNQSGENALFWEDLSQAKLIEGTFATATDAAYPGAITSSFGKYLPEAKIGNSNYVYVSSYGNGINYFGLSVPTTIATDGSMNSVVGLTVQQAYDIDKKIDDGAPLTGRVNTNFTSGALGVSASASWLTDTAGTCYNWSGTYSLSSAAKFGANINCALTFQFQ